MVDLAPEQGSLEVEVRFVLRQFICTYLNCTEDYWLQDHHVFALSPEGVRSTGTEEGMATPQNSFVGLDSWTLEEKTQLYWKILCSGSCCARSNCIIRILADLSDKNVTLVHEGVKVVNIYKVRNYMPLKGLQRDFMLDYYETSGIESTRYTRLYPVLSYYLDQFPDLPDGEYDKEVKVAQTEAVAAKLGVGTDDICLHYWTVLTLEDGTMLHIDTAGPAYECYEYEENFLGGTSYPLVLRKTTQLLIEDPNPTLKTLYPDTLVLTNKSMDGSPAELPAWRPFELMEHFPYEILFLQGFGEYHNFQEPHIHSINMTVSSILDVKMRRNEEDIEVELYNLIRQMSNNRKRGTVKCGTNMSANMRGTYNPRFPVKLDSGRIVAIKPQNIRLLPHQDSQYCTRRQVEIKYGFEHKVCNCADWRNGIQKIRKGLEAEMWDCVHICNDEDEEEAFDEEDCELCGA